MSQSLAKPLEEPAEPRLRLRWLVRGTVLTLAILSLWPSVARSRAPLVVPAMSPFVAIASLVATGMFSLAGGLGLAMAAIVLVRRRWLCRWVCPTGTCAEMASRMGARLGLRTPRLPAAGQWIALATLGGAALGYPVLLWLDPLALFSGAFTPLGPASGAAARLGPIALAVLLLVSVAMPGAWCARLCPLGGTQELLFALRRLAPRWGGLRSDPSDHRAKWRGARRTVLAIGAGVAWAALTRKRRAAQAMPLRPPGAAAEETFVGLCVRCGNCVRACPTRIIAPETGAYGLAGLLTPTLVFREDYCLETCTLCTQVCPSGALTPLAPAEKRRAPIGRAQVDMELCLLAEDRECAICRSRCPYDAITYVFSPESYMVTPHIDAARCPGCGACEAACPTKPTPAIFVRRPHPS